MDNQEFHFKVVDVPMLESVFSGYVINLQGILTVF